MNDVSNAESDKELERKVQGIVLAHLYLKKRERQENVSIQELKDRVSSLDQMYLKVDLIKLWNDSNWVEITDSNDFSITNEGIAEEEKRIREKSFFE